LRNVEAITYPRERGDGGPTALVSLPAFSLEDRGYDCDFSSYRDGLGTIPSSLTLVFATTMQSAAPPSAAPPLLGHQHQEHVVTALAGLAEAREPVLGAGEQLCRMRPSRTPRPKRRTSSGSRSIRPPAIRICWHLDRVQGRPGDQIKADSRTAQCLRLPDDRAQRSRRADPSQGHAGDPDPRRGAGGLAASALG
jgi:hypothetical protein